MLAVAERLIRDMLVGPGLLMKQHTEMLVAAAGLELLGHLDQEALRAKAGMALLLQLQEVLLLVVVAVVVVQELQIVVVQVVVELAGLRQHPAQQTQEVAVEQDKIQPLVQEAQVS